MYLKKLEMKGFKSFADNTEIYFKPGVNIIVGPNGCGKSNLVDAVRWVLGEANVRQLRGQKSEDVIFNGTDRARPLSMASVELTLDNEDNVLPLDFSEITVGRKIFRSGESEFYINKSRVRMKDVNKLFTGTGLGKCGYSIISQGELEKVLNGQPLDRRLLLEEASGVIKYRQQINEVKARIEATSNDLIRLDDILGEIVHQKDELEQKAARAEIYLRLTDEFNFFKHKVMLFEIARIKNEIDKNCKALKEKREKLNSLNSVVKEKEFALKGLEEKLLKEQKDLESLKERKYLLESDLNALKSTIGLSQEKINNKEERLRSAREDNIRYSQMITKVREEIEKINIDCLKKEKEYNEKLRKYQELEEKLQILGQEIEDKSWEFEVKKEQVFKITEQAAYARNKFIKTEERIKKVKEKKERLDIKLEELCERIKKQHEEIMFLKQKKAENEEEIPRMKEELETILAEKNAVLSQISQINQRIDDLNRKKMELSHKIAYIDDIQKKLGGYSSAVRFILNAKSKIPGILGVLGELIEVPPGMEIAFDAAAGRGLENIVVDKAATAERAISLLKQSKAGRVTFLPLDILKVQKIPDRIAKELEKREGVLGIASRLVKYDPIYEKAVEYLLGRVVVVNEVKQGIILFKVFDFPLRIVTLEGEIINPSGAMTGGSKKEDVKTPLYYKSEARKLAEEKKNIEIVLAKEDKLLFKFKRELEGLEKTIAEQKNRFSEINFTYEMLKNKLFDLEEDISSLEKEKQALVREQSMIEREFCELEQEISILGREQEEKYGASEEIAAELDILKQELEDKKRDFKVYDERLSSYNEQIKMKLKELENFKHNIKQFKEVESSYRQAVSEAQELEKKLLLEIEEEKKNLIETKRKLDYNFSQLDSVNGEISKVRKKEEALKQQLEELRMSIEPLKSDILKTDNQIKNLEIALARLETENDNVSQKFLEDFKCPPPQVFPKLPAVKEVNEYKKRMEILSREIEKMGPVDVEAIKSYQEIKQRYDFLIQQYEDLKEGKESLEKLLEETEKLMHRDFSRFLTKASESFRKTFIEIFGGGEARLKLEPAEDELQSGVEIEVKMPGKRTQSLSLLSGGERALTCIAFIFALLRLKPAPFCLLDEIDAALDESNLNRFSRFVKKMSDEIQFIIITHRQATIESGEVIYGVTMPEKGVSSVLTLTMEDVESIAG
ncbi:chromosome segregation protein SMC [Thermosyntropha sp.]|uniref:chromosome segregation protein SMC n=1 Tax=Thermosyntropha sp. TaxID=2740820 RepID=UPI0025D2422C|nr:chromosome segregation protein SMC [Thermosyntropha sp.]MBO8159436.1 chromosome segregation protein SMC [Thermosyntropha sp.]